MKNIVIAVSALLIVAFSTDSFSFSGMRMLNRAIIHASGAGTGGGTYSPPPPSSEPRIIQVPQPASPPSSQQGGAGAAGRNGGVKKFVIMGKPFLARPSTAGESLFQGGGGHALKKPEDRKPLIEVIGRDGKRLMAYSMHNAIDDQLRIFSGENKMQVSIPSIRYIKFIGHDEINDLEVTIALSSGEEVVGKIYSRTVFEFVSDYGVVVTYADQLESVEFVQE